jgi:hypothetical protein
LHLSSHNPYTTLIAQTPFAAMCFAALAIHLPIPPHKAHDKKKRSQPLSLSPALFSILLTV